MKRTMTLIAAVLLALGLAGPAGAKSDNARTDHKVDICHYPGHESERGRSDFEVRGLRWEHICERTGGHVISVSAKGAANGHGVG